MVNNYVLVDNSEPAKNGVNQKLRKTSRIAHRTLMMDLFHFLHET